MVFVEDAHTTRPCLALRSPTLRTAVLLTAGLLAASCGESPIESWDSTPGEVYLDEALSLLETQSLHRYEVDWSELRKAVRSEAGRIETPRDAYPAIRHALDLIGERHSRFIEPADRDSPDYVDPPPLVRLAPNIAGSTARIGYVRVEEAVGKAIDELATSYHRGIERVDTTGVCGWIVDLRNNDGGSMWPMIAGIGPIVGEGVLGYSVYPDSVAETWSYAAGASRKDGVPYAKVADPYVLAGSGPPPVAVLVNQRTASSAEATFLSFVGRPATRTIGRGTAGYSTTNYGYAMSDGAVLLITVAVMADRTGKAYGGRIWPDTLSSGDGTLDPDSDLAFGAALKWLATQGDCVGG
jgi:hypothetical protein